MSDMDIFTWELSGVPVSFILGLDGLPYAVLPNSYEAEDYARILGDTSDYPALYCCAGFENGVRLQETLGM